MFSHVLRVYRRTLGARCIYANNLANDGESGPAAAFFTEDSLTGFGVLRGGSDMSQLWSPPLRGILGIASGDLQRQLLPLNRSQTDC